MGNSALFNKYFLKVYKMKKIPILIVKEKRKKDNRKKTII